MYEESPGKLIKKAGPSPCMILMQVFVHHTLEKQWYWGLYYMYNKVFISLFSVSFMFFFISLFTSTGNLDTFELGKQKSLKNWGVYQGLQNASLWVEISLQVYCVFRTWWSPHLPPPFAFWVTLDRLNRLLGHSLYCSLLPCTLASCISLTWLIVNGVRLWWPYRHLVTDILAQFKT